MDYPVKASHRPSFQNPFASQRKPKRHKIGTEVLAQRQAAGLDLWTGEPLKGDDLTAWKMLAFDVDMNPDKTE